MKRPLASLATASLAAFAALSARGTAVVPDSETDPRRTYAADGWELAWSAEFDGADPLGYLEDWCHEVGFVRNHEPQYYTSNRVENCRVEDGALVITARREKCPNPDYKDRALGGYGNKIVGEEYVDERTGKTVPVSAFPMEMKIDWVRHYHRTVP